MHLRLYDSWVPWKVPLGCIHKCCHANLDNVYPPLFLLSRHRPYALLSQNALPPPPLCVTSFMNYPLAVSWWSMPHFSTKSLNYLSIYDVIYECPLTIPGRSLHCTGTSSWRNVSGKSTARTSTLMPSATSWAWRRAPSNKMTRTKEFTHSKFDHFIDINFTALSCKRHGLNDLFGHSTRFYKLLSYS